MKNILMCACLLLTACGDDDDGVPMFDAAAPVADAGAIDAAPAIDAMPTFDAAPCHLGANLGTVVMQEAIAEAAPVTTGGVITDGTFAVTADKVYTGVGGQAGLTGQTIKATSTNDGAGFEYIEALNGAAASTAFSGTFSTADGMITINIACPVNMAGTAINTYNATADEFTLYDPNFPLGVRGITYTRVP